MRRPRIKSPGEGFYHVVSRISGRRFLMDDGEKDILLGMVRAAAAFSGVEVYTYALMDNHFHLLLRVPQRKEVDDAELSRRVRALYGPERSGRLFAQWGQWLSAGDAVRVEEARERLRARMYDLSQFIKTFNRKKGTDHKIRGNLKEKGDRPQNTRQPQEKGDRPQNTRQPRLHHQRLGKRGQTRMPVR